jgi:hypothetical protein
MYLKDTEDGRIELWVDCEGDGDPDDFIYQGTFSDAREAEIWYVDND